MDVSLVDLPSRIQDALARLLDTQGAYAKVPANSFWSRAWEMRGSQSMARRWQKWKDSFPPHLVQLQRANNPATVDIELIQSDVSRSFGNIECFDQESRECIIRVLQAYASHNPQVRYCQGMHIVAAVLVVMSGHEDDSFLMLVHLMDFCGLGDLYRERFPLLERYCSVCLTLSELQEVHEHLRHQEIKLNPVLQNWFQTLFIDCLPFHTVCLIWDELILEGPSIMCKVAVLLVYALKERFLSMDFDSFRSSLRGAQRQAANVDDETAVLMGQSLVQQAKHVHLPELIVAKDIMAYVGSNGELFLMTTADCEEHAFGGCLTRALSNSWSTSWRIALYSAASSFSLAGVGLAGVRAAATGFVGGPIGLGVTLASVGVLAAAKKPRRMMIYVTNFRRRPVYLCSVEGSVEAPMTIQPSCTGIIHISGSSYSCRVKYTTENGERNFVIYGDCPMIGSHSFGMRSNSDHDEVTAWESYREEPSFKAWGIRWRSPCETVVHLKPESESDISYETYLSIAEQRISCTRRISQINLGDALRCRLPLELTRQLCKS